MASEWFYFRGRRVRIANGERTQTVNVCDEANVLGRYEHVVRLDANRVDRDAILARSGMQDLITWLTSERAGRIEKQPVPDANVTTTAAEAPNSRLTSLMHDGSSDMGPDRSEPADMIHPVYLPFSVEQLRRHFAPVAGMANRWEVDRHIRYYSASARRYATFEAAKQDRRGLSVADLRQPCQIEKDERFWVVACFMRYFYSSSRTALLADLMRRCFPGDAPPIIGMSWESFFGDENLCLYFEVNLPSPQSYKDNLRTELRRRHIIPYIFDAACIGGSDEFRRDLEGATHVDAVILNPTSGCAVLIEAKVLSDVAATTTFDVLRNQIARNVDVMLDANPHLPHPLCRRDPSKTLFVLLTPRLFKENPHTRLYGHLWQVYKRSHDALAKDLDHRNGTDWPDVVRRIGWLTWEDARDALPSACPWIEQA